MFRDRMRRRCLRAVAPFLIVGIFLVGCSHSRKKSAAAPAAATTENAKLEAVAEKAVERTEEDERMAGRIQSDLNALFFHGKEENPGGLDAFSADRIQELEMDLMSSEKPSLKYYRENREFFDRIEDAGGGFRIVANAKRLVPHRWTKAGRRKLFAMDRVRVREMTANPCFSAIEDCGEYASDGEENTTLLDEWVKKYGEPEFRAERDKLVRSYLASLEKYRKRITRHLPTRTRRDGEPETPKAKRAKQAAALVDTHIRGIQLLLKDGN